jgi:hypothetical protein
MCPSTEATDAQQQEFAAEILRNLLQRIDAGNAVADHSKGHYTFVVSHAWTDGPMMYLVYTAPPSNKTWGLVRDTTRSLINPSPWGDEDDPALYYYLLDLEEDWPGNFSRQPDEPDTISWSGYPLDNLYERPSDIPDAYRYTGAHDAK